MISKPRPISRRARAAAAHDQALDDLALRDGRVGDRVDVLERDVAVHDVLGLDHDRRADLAEIEAARGARARTALRDATLERALP